MPQWPRPTTQHPDERWLGSVPAADADLLRRFDHHTVWIEGRLGLLLTAPWAEPPLNTDRFHFTVSYTYAKGHPRAPTEVQELMSRVDFKPGHR